MLSLDHPKAVALAAVVLAGTLSASFQDPSGQRPTFRTSTELVSIEAQVIDRDGAPVERLTADNFEVFLDGRRRPLAHVQFLRSNAAVTATASGSPENPFPGGRVVVLAVDQGSFPMAAQASAREAAAVVMNSLSPEDYVGIVTFPAGAAVAPSRDHDPVQKVVERIVGHRTDLVRSRFNLSAVEASQLRSRDSFATQGLIARECRGAYPDPTCRQELIQDGGRIADALEQQAVLSLNGLYGALEGVGSLPGRKTMILISAGLPMRPGGTPNLDAETSAIARRAAAANINLYVFYMNVHFLRFFSAEYGKVNHTLYDDITMFGYGLEKFADVAGGSFAQVNVDPDPFVARVLRETSATYILGVEVRPEDRDGKDHFIRLNVKQRGVTLRYRRVVNIPRTQ
jgi:VWFA-related protein